MDAHASPPPHPWITRLIYTGISLAVIIGGITGAGWMIRNKPRAQPVTRQHQVPIVEVMTPSPTSLAIRVHAMGNVEAAQTVDLKSEISGRVLETHSDLVPGGMVSNGTVLVRLDDRDYRLTLERADASLMAAQADYRLELGQQDIARQEWNLVNQDAARDQLDHELALRQPQLQQKQAAVAAAQAARNIAALALERTVLTAPFDAVVISADANPGDQASPSTILARLACTDEYWIRAAVRVADLKWLTAQTPAAPGSTAIITLQDNHSITGSLFRILPNLETKGRLAQILISVPHPFDTQRRSPDGTSPLLLLDSYVRIRLLGQTVDNVLVLPRALFHEGSAIWVLDANRRLQIRTVNPVWSDDREVVLPACLQPGDRVIQSLLETPVTGMQLMAEGEPAPAADPDHSPPASDGNTP
ncbi:MAG: hypothetical protein A2340_15555 [Lentisphaerae bacterium RIFOXYB12_FULL_60_10]|nr:MAG: hypothetical protein A2340_15555 [Lentisphaerae bacterium RIFOXYB12_FULL_60_10]